MGNLLDIFKDFPGNKIQGILTTAKNSGLFQDVATLISNKACLNTCWLDTGQVYVMIQHFTSLLKPLFNKNVAT